MNLVSRSRGTLAKEEALFIKENPNAKQRNLNMNSTLSSASLKRIPTPSIFFKSSKSPGKIPSQEEEDESITTPKLQNSSKIIKQNAPEKLSFPSSREIPTSNIHHTFTSSQRHISRALTTAETQQNDSSTIMEGGDDFSKHREKGSESAQFQRENIKRRTQNFLMIQPPSRNQWQSKQNEQISVNNKSINAKQKIFDRSFQEAPNSQFYLTNNYFFKSSTLINEKSKQIPTNEQLSTDFSEPASSTIKKLFKHQNWKDSTTVSIPNDLNSLINQPPISPDIPFTFHTPQSSTLLQRLSQKKIPFNSQTNIPLTNIGFFRSQQNLDALQKQQRKTSHPRTKPFHGALSFSECRGKNMMEWNRNVSSSRNLESHRIPRTSLKLCSATERGVSADQIQSSASMQQHNSPHIISLFTGNKQMNLAATDFQFQKQARLKEIDKKKNRFGQEIFNHFVLEINKLRKNFASKQELEPIFAHYRQSEDISTKTLIIADKCLQYKKCRAPLENLLQGHSKVVASCKHQPHIQLFVLLQIAKMFVQIGSPLLAIPILKVVKRLAFLHMDNTYLMKAYRSLARCFISLSQFEIAFGYAAKYLHLTWSCDSQNNELDAYEMLGQIFYYKGDTKKSAYYHMRMTSNLRESDNSSLKKMQIENLKVIHKRRYEILATREMKKRRAKYEEKLDHSFFLVSSDDENDLNNLIPEENKDAIAASKDTNDRKKSTSPDDSEKEKFYYQNNQKLTLPIRKIPKYDIKSDKTCKQNGIYKANCDIRIQTKQKEEMDKFLKKPLESFIQLKGSSSIGPMRDRLLVSHKSFNKNLQNYLVNTGNRREKTSNIFFTSSKFQDEVEKEKDIDKRIYSQSDQSNDYEIDLEIKQKLEQSEYWRDSMVKRVEKSLRKLSSNIKYFLFLQGQLKEQQEEKIKKKRFFDFEGEPVESESEKILRQIDEENQHRQACDFPDFK